MIVYKGNNPKWQLYFHHDVLPQNWRRFGKSTQARGKQMNPWEIKMWKVIQSA